jgi:hypothetical protein
MGAEVLLGIPVAAMGAAIGHFLGRRATFPTGSAELPADRAAPFTVPAGCRFGVYAIDEAPTKPDCTVAATASPAGTSLRFPCGRAYRGTTRVPRIAGSARSMRLPPAPIR